VIVKKGTNNSTNMELTAGYTHGPHIMEINNTNTPQVLDPSVISYVIKQLIDL